MQCTCTYEHVTLENNKNQQVDCNIIHKYVTNKKKWTKQYGYSILILYKIRQNVYVTRILSINKQMKK